MQDTARRERRAFTLVEMLVVIVIIGIMSGIMFRLFSFLGRSAGKAKCIEELERIGNALNEFRAEYGQYPPVDFVEYEYENPTNQTPNFNNVYLPQHPEQSIPFRYGLIAYLWPRSRGTIKHTNNDGWVPDTDRDTMAKAKWNHFIDPVWDQYLSVSDEGSYEKFHPQHYQWTNLTETIVDPWGSPINYRCYKPFLTYELWSNGADGSNGTADDVHYEKWDN